MPAPFARGIRAARETIVARHRLRPYIDSPWRRARQKAAKDIRRPSSGEDPHLRRRGRSPHLAERRLAEPRQALFERITAAMADRVGQARCPRPGSPPVPARPREHPL